MTVLTPVELHGAQVRLAPLEPSHLDGLWQAAQSPEIWDYLPQRVRTRDDLQSWLTEALAGQSAGHELPFTIFDEWHKRIVGSTRFLDFTPAHRGIEIGGTWLHPSVWRTRVNTECKYLLLIHCFETLDLIRVTFKTDARNARSQNAIARLGAVREGILRSHRILQDGYVRDSVYFSILRAEWPAVKQNLERALTHDAERQDA